MAVGLREELSNGEGFDELLCENFSIEIDLDRNKLHDFLHKAGINEELNIEDALWKLGVARLTDNVLAVNNAGVLFFALEPEKFVEQSCITCVRYQGTDKFNILDRADLSGDLLYLVNEAETFVKKNTRIASKFIGFQRIDKEEYPYTAIREAIINAVCHRNYYFNSTLVFVNIFDDRIEVVSPGSIPFGLTLKEVMNKSFPRNKLLLKLFNKINEVERLGSGLNKMKKLMKEHGLKEPVFEARRASFQVTFPGPKEKILDLIKDSRIIDLRELGLNERQIKALNFLSQKMNRINSSQFCKMFNVTKATATFDLNELIKLNFIARNGKGKATNYFLKQ
ncbi:MAG: ATP-binding protein [Candidatus Diapherotrites archaeon]